MITLIAAVPFETEQLRRTLSPWEVLNFGGYDLYLCSLAGHHIGLLHCGVGKANSAAAATALIAARKPQMIISIGCGGAYPGSHLAPGDLTLATMEIYGDEGVLSPEGFLDMEDIGFPLVRKGGIRYFNQFPVNRQLVEKATPILAATASSAGRRLETGPFVTVSTCSGTLAAGKLLAERTGGICENMEGAAIAHICQMHNTPFLEIRGISNFVEDRDLSRWDLRAATTIAQQGALDLLENWDERNISA